MANAASAFTLYRDALVGKTSFAVGRFEAVDSPQVSHSLEYPTIAH